MSGLRQHGVKWLSASSINTYIASPAFWVYRYLYNQKSGPSAAMVRGIATETGVAFGLEHPDVSVEECIVKALAEYDEKLAMSNDPKFDSERKNIRGFVEYALAELRQYGVPTSSQEKVQIELPGVSVPFIGYTDFEYQDHGIVVDLKSTLRMPSSISDAHARQGAIYAAARGNYAMRFAYVKPRPSKGEDRACNVYEMTADDVRQRLHEVTEVARRIDRFLAISTDRDEIAGLLVPDFSSFYWNDEAEERGRTLFGLDMNAATKAIGE